MGRCGRCGVSTDPVERCSKLAVEHSSGMRWVKLGDESYGAAAGHHVRMLPSVEVVVDVGVVRQDRTEHDQRGGHDAEHVRPADVARSGVVGPRPRAVMLRQLRVESDRQRHHRTDQDHRWPHHNTDTEFISCTRSFHKLNSAAVGQLKYRNYDGDQIWQCDILLSSKNPLFRYRNSRCTLSLVI